SALPRPAAHARVGEDRRGLRVLPDGGGGSALLPTAGRRRTHCLRGPASWPEVDLHLVEVNEAEYGLSFDDEVRLVQQEFGSGGGPVIRRFVPAGAFSPGGNRARDRSRSGE